MRRPPGWQPRFRSSASKRASTWPVSAEALAGRSNVNAASDVAVAANLAEAAARGAAANVVINLPSVEDEAFAGSLIGRVKDHVDAVEHLVAAAREAALSGDPRPPLPAAGS